MTNSTELDSRELIPSWCAERDACFDRHAIHIAGGRDVECSARRKITVYRGC